MQGKVSWRSNQHNHIPTTFCSGISPCNHLINHDLVLISVSDAPPSSVDVVEWKRFKKVESTHCFLMLKAV